MIDTNVFNKEVASDEEILACMSQKEELDCCLCRVCQHFHKCVGFSMKRVVQILKENEND